MIARKTTHSEWESKLQPHTPAEVRGLVDAMTKFSNEAPNFLPLSALDDEVCAAAVTNAVNFILGKEFLQSAPAWLYSRVNADKLEKVYDRSHDFEIQGESVVETFDRGFRLSNLLEPQGMYILGYHYRETQADPKIIAADADKNSHLMLLLSKADGRWYGYHLLHYPGQDTSNPVLVEPVDEMPKLLDLVYIWQVKDVVVPDKGKDLFIVNTNLPYSAVRPWLNNGPDFSEYYIDTVTAWFVRVTTGSQQFPIVIDLDERDVVEVPGNGAPFHGRIMGFYNKVPIYYHGGTDRRGKFGLEFQCVELINRYYASLGHQNMTRLGHADAYFWQAEGKGLVSFPQGGTEKPRRDDILVFDISNNDGFPGHVAVIYSVTDTYTCFVQQNVDTTWRTCLPLLQTDGKWQVLVPKDKKKTYRAVAGWARIRQ